FPAATVFYTYGAPARSCWRHPLTTPVVCSSCSCAAQAETRAGSASLPPALRYSTLPVATVFYQTAARWQNSYMDLSPLLLHGRPGVLPAPLRAANHGQMRQTQGYAATPPGLPNPAVPASYLQCS